MVVARGFNELHHLLDELTLGVLVLLGLRLLDEVVEDLLVLNVDLVLLYELDLLNDNLRRDPELLSSGEIMPKQNRHRLP